IARRDTANYSDIHGGNGTTKSDLKHTRTDHAIPETYTKEQVAAWFNSGAAAGPIKTSIEQGVTDLLEWIDQKQQAGVPMITGSMASLSNNNTPLLTGAEGGV